MREKIYLLSVLLAVGVAVTATDSVMIFNDLNYCQIQETRLGPIPAAVKMLCENCPGGHHVVWIVEKDGKLQVVFDGQAGPFYEDIGKILLDFYNRNLYPMQTVIQFSSDGRHWAYTAQRAGKWRVVFDGREGPETDGIHTITFSPDGRHIAYQAKFGKQCAVVWDGRIGPPGDRISFSSGPFGRGSPFSPDSRHLAYTMIRGKMATVVFDGRPGPDFSRILSGSLVFSPDSLHLVYAAELIGQWGWVENGRLIGMYDAPAKGFPVFSPDSRHLAHLVKTGGMMRLILDGKPFGPALSETSEGTCGSSAFDWRTLSPVFSPDGNRIAYAACDANRKSVVVVDGVPGPAFSAVRNASIKFSPDSRPVYYAASDKTPNWFCTKDGVVIGATKGVSMPVFSPDGRRSALVTKTGDRKYRVLADDRLEPEFSFLLDPPRFSKNGKWLAYRILIEDDRSHRIWTVLNDQLVGESWNHSEDDCPVCFSPDGERVAYEVRPQGMHAFVVTDGVPGPDFAFIQSLQFSPDGSHVVYVGWGHGINGQTKKYLVIDGVKVGDYEFFGKQPLSFNTDGKLEFLAQRDRQLYRITVDLLK